MWTTVYIVTGLDKAKKVEEELRREGFLVKIRYFTREAGEDLYEILAPEFEVKDIEEVMIELGIL